MSKGGEREMSKESILETKGEMIVEFDFGNTTPTLQEEEYLMQKIEELFRTLNMKASAIFVETPTLWKSCDDVLFRMLTLNRSENDGETSE
jgi:uncharacterized protein YifE (UPF0438 family)